MINVLSKFSCRCKQNLPPPFKLQQKCKQFLLVTKMLKNTRFSFKHSTEFQINEKFFILLICSSGHTTQALQNYVPCLAKSLYLTDWISKPNQSLGGMHTPREVCGADSLSLPLDHLVGLVVKVSSSGAEDPGFESCLRRDFSEVESYQWLKNWHSSGYLARHLGL